MICVDVRNQLRPENKEANLVLVGSERLPFRSDSFDLVISHHVIEHVHDQMLHLAEIRRVLNAGGVCYLGTPNKSSPLMRGHVGNPCVLSYSQVGPLFKKAGFNATDYSA